LFEHPAFTGGARKLIIKSAQWKINPALRHLSNRQAYWSTAVITFRHACEACSDMY
jgi:hypothetical protein